MNTGIEIANRLEQWMLDEGELSTSDTLDISNEAACLMHYFPEVDSTEAEALSFLLYYATEENRMAVSKAIPLVLGDTNFSRHLIRCCEDQIYWDCYVSGMDTFNDPILVEEVYYDTVDDASAYLENSFMT